jgi:5-oxoprolinase (ATP-hydrolysing) subunit A
MNLCIDLNADLGEGCGSDLELLSLVTSASIACGFHAGDPATMQATLSAAKDAGVAVGAHPSLADRDHFGRRELPITPKEAFAIVSYQIGAFAALAQAVGLRPQHVKPHGALYNMAARDPILAEAVARAIASTDSSLLIFTPPASALAQAAQTLGLRVAREFFADRNYLSDGSLVPRNHPDALLHDPSAAAARVLRLLREGVVRTSDGTDLALQADTVCLHGDTPEAVEFARSLRAALLTAGIQLTAVGSRLQSSQHGDG